MGRVGIVSPLSAVPGCRLHCEEGRGRGAVSIFLLVPEEPATALSRALEMLHDPRGPADLDQRLGQLAAAAPKGISFLVALEQHVWVYPSELTQIRLLKEHGIVETLGEPQVVRLADGQRIELIAASTGEAIALAGHAPPNEAAAPAKAARSRVPIAWPPRLPKIPAPITHPRLAAIAGAGVALGIFVLFRLFSHSPEDASASTETERTDAYVESDLETKVLETIADPAKKSTSVDAENANEKKTEQREWTFDSRAAITSSPLVVGPLVVFGSRDSTLYCLDAASGETKWSYAAGSGIGSSPRASRNLCVVGTYAGKVLAVDLKSGKLEWEGRTGGRIAANPCLTE
ncbi:MAG TPA: PQQ-binding-like beta-propeller repeat protein, partial [bacterium]|nr:PQQ-binding-like beta-propeller repeat protein [bacterium]